MVTSTGLKIQYLLVEWVMKENDGEGAFSYDTLYDL
jgi:hypothetical protein